jgi:hypothetical protein
MTTFQPGDYVQFPMIDPPRDDDGYRLGEVAGVKNLSDGSQDVTIARKGSLGRYNTRKHDLYMDKHPA